MPPRPPTPAASVTWQVADTPALTHDADVSVRHALLLVNATGFLAGYYAMHNQWVQMAWFGVMTAAWFALGGVQDFAAGLLRDRWLMAVVGLTGLLLVRSSVVESPGMTMTDLWAGWAKAGLLVAVLLMIWQVAREPRVIRRVGLPLVLVACAAAVGSLVMFYKVHPEGVFGCRLRNWFIYGGWNTVCTGLTFGFAATWAAACWNNATSRHERRLWLLALLPLLAATLFTLSRGALFALVVAHLALLAVRGWRRAWRPFVLLAAAIGLFQGSAPLLSSMAVMDASKRMGVTDQAVAAQMIGDAVVSANPMGKMVERSDNGRLEIYSGALGSMTTWQDWLLGKGLWSANDFWSCSLHWYPEHLHSVFMDALVRGGVPGLAGLLFILGWGMHRILVLARQGEDIWLMLACFGIAGVMFDGDSAFSLLTVPRFEVLILWVPLVMASARFTAAPTRRRPA